MFDTDKLKRDFPLFENMDNGQFSYLDSAASTQTPLVVIQSMNEYYTSYRANIHRGLYPQSMKATAMYEQARQGVARFIGAKTEEVIFTSGATASMNMLVYMLEHSLDFSPGDEIVVSVMEHHSTLVPLQELARRKKLKIVFIEITKNTQLDEDHARAVLGSDRVKVVALTLASNVVGTINNVREILKYIPKGKTPVRIVDASQAVGHMPVRVDDMPCDFLVFSGHKMCGPTGIGVMYGRLELLERFEPGFYGGNMVQNVDRERSLWKDPPEKFEAGTSNIAGAIGLGRAVEYIDTLGAENILSHSQNITSYALELLSQKKFVTLKCNTNPQENIGIVSFVIDGVHAHDVAQVFADHHVAIRAGHHCAMPLAQSLGAVAVNRASFYAYSTREDVERLVTMIDIVHKMF